MPRNHDLRWMMRVINAETPKSADIRGGSSTPNQETNQETHEDDDHGGEYEYDYDETSDMVSLRRALKRKTYVLAFPKSHHCLLPLFEYSRKVTTLFAHTSYEHYERLTLFVHNHSDAGVSVENLDEIERARNFAVKMANDSKTPTHLRVNGSALKTCDTLLDSARYALRGRNRYEKNTGFGTNNASVDAYRLAVSKSFEDSSEKKEKVTLSLWALNPALAFADLTGPGPGTARSVVLTSGTLAPLDSFASELGAPFPIRMEAPHCVDVNTQVWAGAVASGTNGTKLSGTFKTSVEFAYQDDLGASLEKWCLEIPHGVLVFFPSYSLLDRVAQRWKATGAWRRIEQSTGKKLFTEPRGSGGGDFSAGGGGGRGGKGGRAGSKGGRGNARDASNGSLDDLLQKYYRAVRNSVAAAPHAHAPAPPTHACRGAVLLAVCRGKVSEGIDFADANARGVIVVGIPYPNLKDKQVELKRKYNDERARAGAGVLSGNEWYAQQAFRALNQAVGRCLRHRNDHGAVLLVDERYAHGGNGSLTANLPKWLRPALKKCADFGDSVIGLRLFFENRSANPPKPSSDLSGEYFPTPNPSDCLPIQD
jgi:Fanconi anemia group J protein